MKKRKKSMLFVEDGCRLAQNGDFDKAIASFKLATQIDPEHYNAWFYLILAYRDSKNFEKFHEAIDKSRNSKELEYVKYKRDRAQWMEMLSFWLRNGAFDMVLKKCQEVIELDPDNYELWAYIGMVHEMKKNKKDANESFLMAINNADLALRRNSDEINALLTKGKAYFYLRNDIKAVEFLKKVLQLSPKSQDALFTLSDAYKELGDINNCISTLKRVLEFYPNNLRALSTLGEIFTALQKYKQAFEYLEKAFEIIPDDYKTLVCLGLCKVQIGQVADGLELLEKAIELNPKDKLGWDFLTIAQGQVLSDEKKMIETRVRYINVNPDDISGYLTLGMALEDAKKYNLALTYYNKATKLEPIDTFSWDSLGVIYDKLGNYKKALKCFKRSIELFNLNKEAMFDMGCCYEFSLGDHKKAIKTFKLVINIQPIDIITIKSCGNISLAYEKLGDIERSKLYKLKAEYAEACIQGGFAVEKMIKKMAVMGYTNIKLKNFLIEDV